MDFSLSSDQELIRDSARKFVENECSKETVREMFRSEKGYDPVMWQKMADLGWMGLALPEEFGGVGGGMIDLALVLEEMGRGLLPGPFFSTVAACAFPILAFGTAEQKERYLPSIATGEAIGSLALTEESGTLEATGIGVEAKAGGRGLYPRRVQAFRSLRSCGRFSAGCRQDQLEDPIRMRASPCLWWSAKALELKSTFFRL